MDTPNVSPWIGPAIIAAFVGFAGTLVAQYFARRGDRADSRDKLFTTIAMPSLDAADDIVARFFDIVVRGRAEDQSVVFDRERLRSSEVITSPSPIERALFRVVRFMAASNLLQRRRHESNAVPRIRQVNFFVLNKARMALKGNVVPGSLGVATELQQATGDMFSSENGVHEVTYYEFVNRMRGAALADGEAGDQAANDALSAVQYLGRVMDVGDGISGTPQGVMVALFLVYLIDAIQDINGVSKWEEFRVMLISVLRTWNSRSEEKSVFLYRSGDLRSNNYLDTFAILESLGEQGTKKRNKRIRKRCGPSRKVIPEGVRKERRGGDSIMLSFAASPADIVEKLKSL